MTYDWTGETKKSRHAEQVIIALLIFSAGAMVIAFLLEAFP
jgi:hypothetical protein